MVMSQVLQILLRIKIIFKIISDTQFSFSGFSVEEEKIFNNMQRLFKIWHRISTQKGIFPVELISLYCNDPFKKHLNTDLYFYLIKTYLVKNFKEADTRFFGLIVLLTQYKMTQQ